MLPKLPLVLIFLLALIGTLPAQQRLDRARGYFAAGDYRAAEQEIADAGRGLRSKPEARLLLAVSRLQLNKLDGAATLLSSLVEEKKEPYPVANYYLGRTLQLQHRFVPAAEYYKRYLRSLAANAPERRLTIELIRSCDNGRQLIERTPRLVVENLGPEVNSIYDEFAPIPSPTRGGRLYFSAFNPANSGGVADRRGGTAGGGDFFSDIYTTETQGVNWRPARPLDYTLNSPRHEVLLDISPDGRRLYYYQGSSAEDGNFLLDTFQQAADRRLTTYPLDAPLDARAGDGTPFFFGKNLILFSSSRPGGQGGLDIYRVRRRNDGGWTQPENLGPRINSAYDETTPFLANDGRTLYFSSNDAARSIGGYDVLRSYLLEDSDTWTQAENPGLPLNSAADDTHFRLAYDAFTAYLCSDRPDGYGERDLYVVYYQDPQEEMDRPAPAPAELVQTTPPPPPGANRVMPNAVPQTTVVPRPDPTPPSPAPPIPVPFPIVTSPVPDPVPAPIAPVVPDPSVTDSPASALTPFRLALDNNLLRTTDLDRANLRRLTELLRQSPSAPVLVTAYSEVNNGEKLFLAIQRAETVGKELQRFGITAERLNYRCFVSSEIGHDRVDISLIGTDLSPTPAEIGGPLPLNQDVYFGVQALSSKQAYTGTALENLPRVTVETQPGFDYYRYTVSGAATLAEAGQIQARLERAGLKGGYVVAYFRGLRIDRRRAGELVDRFPALREFAGR